MENQHKDLGISTEQLKILADYDKAVESKQTIEDLLAKVDKAERDGLLDRLADAGKVKQALHPQKKNPDGKLYKILG